MTEKSASEVVASGVEALIDRLRDEGVAAGQARADEIITDAQQRARQIIQQAKDEAAEMLVNARNRAQEDERAGMAALKAATRDTVIDLKNRLMQRFTEDVRRLVSTELAKEDVIQRMILEIAGRARDAAETGESVEILLPKMAVDLEQVRTNPDEYSRGTLTQFVRQTSDDMLRDGVTLWNSESFKAGLRVKVGDEGVELDLSDDAITALLLEHLQPRFRAMLDGVVR